MGVENQVLWLCLAIDVDGFLERYAGFDFEDGFWLPSGFESKTIAGDEGAGFQIGFEFFADAAHFVESEIEYDSVSFGEVIFEEIGLDIFKVFDFGEFIVKISLKDGKFGDFEADYVGFGDVFGDIATEMTVSCA